MKMDSLSLEDVLAQRNEDASELFIIIDWLVTHKEMHRLPISIIPVLKNGYEEDEAVLEVDGDDGILSIYEAEKMDFVLLADGGGLSDWAVLIGRDEVEAIQRATQGV